MRRPRGPAHARPTGPTHVRLWPYNTFFRNRGVARKEQGDVAGAIADFTETLRLNPQDALAYFKRGNLHQIQGDVAEAIADYEQYLELGRGMEKGNQEEVEQRIRALRAQLASPKKWRNFWR
jgi:tetratricopeptide (TPR) repeat protein